MSRLMVAREPSERGEWSCRESPVGSADPKWLIIAEESGVEYLSVLLALFLKIGHCYLVMLEIKNSGLYRREQ